MQTLAQYAGYIAAIIGCISAILVPTLKAIKALKKPITEIKAENAEQSKKLDALRNDVACLQGDRLNQAYEHYTERGWCPSSKKRELDDWYNAYKGAGYDHLADHYMQTIFALPEHPNNGGVS